MGSGGFASDFTLAYPVTHSLRRNYTLQPYITDTDLPQFFNDTTKQANASFTPEAINALVTGYIGDFKGFQTAMEAFEGPHSSVHEIMGGYVILLPRH